MFKKLKEKIEEVKSSPQRLQLPNNEKSNDLSTKADSFFSLAEDGYFQDL